MPVIFKNRFNVTYVQMFSDYEEENLNNYLKRASDIYYGLSGQTMSEIRVLGGGSIDVGGGHRCTVSMVKQNCTYPFSHAEGSSDWDSNPIIVRLHDVIADTITQNDKTDGRFLYVRCSSVLFKEHLKKTTDYSIHVPLVSSNITTSCLIQCYLTKAVRTSKTYFLFQQQRTALATCTIWT